MLVVRATKKLLSLVGPSTASDRECGTGLLGSWYATVLFWRPRVVLVVNEATFLPVLMPLAPASTMTGRIADQIATVLAAHDVPAAVVDQEQQHMRNVELGVTANRSVVGG